MRLHLLLLLSVGPSVSSAQKAPPKPVVIPSLADVNERSTPLPELPRARLKLTPTRTIQGAKETLEQVAGVAVGPKGQLAVLGRFNSQPASARGIYQSLRLFDSTGRRLWSINAGGDQEIGWFDAIGWRDGGMWVSDERNSQIALVEHGEVTKSIEIPSWVRPDWNHRKSFPVFGRVSILAVLADGSYIGMPSRPHSLMGGAQYDSTKNYILHFSDGGIIDRMIAAIPSYDYDWQQGLREYRRQNATGPYPPADSPLRMKQYPKFHVSPDGARTVVVSVDSSRAAVDSITVVAKSATGSDVYRQRFAFPRKSYSNEQIDSIMMERYPRASTGERARRAAGYPRISPDIDYFVLGADYSVWITLREGNGVRPVVALDPMGKILGTLYLPRTYSCVAADRDGVWLVDNRSSVKDLVRYRYR